MIRIISSKRLKELEDTERQLHLQNINLGAVTRWLCPLIKELPVITAYIKSSCDCPDILRKELQNISLLKSNIKILNKLEILESNISNASYVSSLKIKEDMYDEFK